VGDSRAVDRAERAWLLLFGCRAKCVGVASVESVSGARRSAAVGVVVRHSRRCGVRAGRVCSCSPSFQAQVWSPRDGRPIRRTFATVAQARAWRLETQVAVKRGLVRAPLAVTVGEAAAEWLAAAEAGVVRTRSGEVYKPSALRSYREALKKVLAELGHRPFEVREQLSDEVIDQLLAGACTEEGKTTL